MNIGDNIRKLRIEKDISQFRLSEVSGVPQTTISNIERDRATPSVVNVMKIARALNIPIEDLLNEELEKE